MADPDPDPSAGVTPEELAVVVELSDFLGGCEGLFRRMHPVPMDPPMRIAGLLMFAGAQLAEIWATERPLDLSWERFQARCVEDLARFLDERRRLAGWGEDDAGAG